MQNDLFYYRLCLHINIFLHSLEAHLDLSKRNWFHVFQNCSWNKLKVNGMIGKLVTETHASFKLRY